ncbi:MAG: HEPN domain-containing protein [Nanoarchaeota archaeon]|nr:HEPN domain-containing protein [Nanoarchaeota archaeon]
MDFDKAFYKKEFERLLSLKTENKSFIKKSNASFKIKKFAKKGSDSLELANYISTSEQNAKDYWTITISYYSMLYLAKAAILTKGYETDDHYSTQIALGHLLVPDEMEKEDLKLLELAYKIFEDDYVEYFHDARKESSVSRYSATKVYTEKRVKEILENAREFIKKVSLILE